MTQLLVISGFDSMVDIITNSSTSLFVVGWKDHVAVEAVREVLNDLGVVGAKDPVAVTSDNWEEIDELIGRASWRIYPNRTERLLGYAYHMLVYRLDMDYTRDKKLTYREEEKFYRNMVEEQLYLDEKDKANWWSRYVALVDSTTIPSYDELKGAVLIIGEDDNSINWENQQLIEDAFTQVRRYHLG